MDATRTERVKTRRILTSRASRWLLRIVNADGVRESLRPLRPRTLGKRLRAGRRGGPLDRYEIADLREHGAPRRHGRQSMGRRMYTT
jgi:hypothetical protein